MEHNSLTAYDGFKSTVTSFPSITASTFYNTRMPLQKKQPTQETNTLSRTSTQKFNKLKQISPSCSEISIADTDDTLFALNEIKRMDFKIQKSKNNKMNVFRKRDKRNIYGENANSNYKDIHLVKQKVKQTGDLEKFDLKGELEKHYYFPMEYLGNIYEAEKLRKKFEKDKLDELKGKEQEKFFDIEEKFSAYRKISLYTFSKEIREICLKNILINIMEKERDKADKKEKAIETALKDLGDELNDDKRKFDKIQREEEKRFKEIESRLYSQMSHNRNEAEKIKQLEQEQKAYQAETEKTLNSIVTNKFYCDFICRVLNRSNKLSEVKLEKLDLNKRVKNYEKEAKKVIETFGFLLTEDVETNENLNANPDDLLSLLSQLEANILQQLQKHQASNMQIFELKRELNQELEAIQVKIDEKDATIDALKNEKKMLNAIEFDSDKSTLINEENKFNEEMLRELYESLFELPGGGKEKGAIELIKELTSKIKKIENTVDDYINKLERIEMEAFISPKTKDLVQKIVTNRKNQIKLVKRNEEKLLNEKKEKEKNLKYYQRHNRVKIKGPVYYPPPNVVKRQERRLQELRKANVVNEYEELYYN